MPSESFIQTLLTALPDISTPRTLAKGEMLVREGDVEQNLYYIENGAVRAFILTEFEELTIRFGYEGSFINSLSSYITGKPSELYIDAIRKTDIRVVPKQDVIKLAQKDAESQQQYIALLELLICQQIEREVDLLTVSPSERLNRVLKRSPNLFQEIPLKYIASYLRMTPETLSRVRNS